MSTSLQYAYDGNSQYIGRGVYTYLLTRQGLWNFINDTLIQPFWEIDELLFDPTDYVKAAYFYPIDLKKEVEKYGGIYKRNAKVSIGGSEYVIKKYENDNVSNAHQINQFQYIDVCSYDIPKYHNNFMDYSPYTKIGLFLPYVGFVDLDVNQVVGKTIYIKYAIDLFSGKCTAYILTTDSNNIQYVVHKFDGLIGVKYDIGNGNFNDVSRNLLKLGASALGSLGGGFIGGSMGSMVGASVSNLALPPPNNPQLSGNVPIDFESMLPKTHNKYVDLTNISNTAVGMLNTGSVHYNRGLNSNFVTGLYDPNSCYLIIERPNPKYPTLYNSIVGKPLYASRKLNSLSGFTIVDEIHLEGFYNATSDEITAIEDTLKGGVIL